MVTAGAKLELIDLSAMKIQKNGTPDKHETKIQTKVFPITQKPSYRVLKCRQSTFSSESFHTHHRHPSPQKQANSVKQMISTRDANGSLPR